MAKLQKGITVAGVSFNGVSTSLNLSEHQEGLRGRCLNDLLTISESHGDISFRFKSAVS